MLIQWHLKIVSNRTNENGRLSKPWKYRPKEEYSLCTRPLKLCSTCIISGVSIFEILGIVETKLFGYYFTSRTARGKVSVAFLEKDTSFSKFDFTKQRTTNSIALCAHRFPVRDLRGVGSATSRSTGVSRICPLARERTEAALGRNNSTSGR